jgi:hypothetical protein
MCAQSPAINRGSIMPIKRPPRRGRGPRAFDGACRLAIACIGAGLLALNPGVRASEATAGVGSTITDPSAISTMPEAGKSVPHPLRIRGRVSYYDPEYRLLWLERDDHTGVYVPLGPNPLPIRTGQYVAIDGKVTPNRGLRPEEVTVRVISEEAPVTPLDTFGRINDLDYFTNRVAVADGYVDSQFNLDDHHVRLVAIVENRPVICWVFADDPAKVADWQGHFVRITGLYSGRFDSTRTTSTIEFWLGSSRDVQVLGSLDSLAGFEIAADAHCRTLQMRARNGGPLARENRGSQARHGHHHKGLHRAGGSPFASGATPGDRHGGGCAGEGRCLE